MKMKSKILMYSIAILLMFVCGSCALSEIYWSIKENNPDSLRQLVGIPSVAVGNLNPSARNPGIELLCTGLYDVPGGYCSYFTMGVPVINFTMASNFTVISDFTESGK
jgi:hypothetical protein